jgi:hypothetical protein
MVRCGVLFEVRTDVLTIIWKSMLRWFPNSKLLLHASHAALPILNSSFVPVVDAADLIVF